MSQRSQLDLDNGLQLDLDSVTHKKVIKVTIRSR